METTRVLRNSCTISFCLHHVLFVEFFSFILLFSSCYRFFNATRLKSKAWKDEKCFSVLAEAACCFSLRFPGSAYKFVSREGREEKTLLDFLIFLLVFCCFCVRTCKQWLHELKMVDTSSTNQHNTMFHANSLLRLQSVQFLQHFCHVMLDAESSVATSPELNDADWSFAPIDE